MARSIEPILGRLRRFHTRNADEAQAFLGGKDYRIDVSHDAARHIDVRINGAYLPGTYLGYYQYGAPVLARSHAGRHDYWINLPLKEPIEAIIGGETLICGRRQGFISSAPLPYVVRTQGSGARLHVQITEDRLNRQLTALLGEPASHPVVFAPSLDLTRGYGRSLADHITLAVSYLENDGGFADNPMATNLFEECIISRLLLSHPNTYTRALSRLARATVAPASLKRAVDYMRARLGEPLGIADIACASGVAGRTLFTHFQDAYGTSPMQFLRARRFDRVREALFRAEPTDSVAQLARRWGFTHLGRFAVEYRQRYGETPSQTLKNGRSRPCP